MHACCCTAETPQANKPYGKRSINVWLSPPSLLPQRVVAMSTCLLACPQSGSVWERLGRMGLGPLWHIRLDRLASGFAASDFYGGERDAFLKVWQQFEQQACMLRSPC